MIENLLFGCYSIYLFLSMILFIPIRYRYHIIPLERRKNLYVLVNFK